MSEGVLTIVLILFPFGIGFVLFCWYGCKYERKKAEERKAEEEAKFSAAPAVPPSMDYQNQRKSKFVG